MEDISLWPWVVEGCEGASRRTCSYLSVCVSILVDSGEVWTTQRQGRRHTMTLKARGVYVEQDTDVVVVAATAREGARCPARTMSLEMTVLSVGVGKGR